MRAISRLLLLAGAWLAGGMLCARAAGSPPLEQITLPAGFHIALFARVPGARSMTLSPGGTLYVGTRGNEVYAIPEADKPDRPHRVLTIARGLNQPNGVAFRDGALYVAEISRVIRLEDIERRLENPPQPVVVTDRYPTSSHHGWKFIRFGPDGYLYVPVGAPCNICEPGDPYASITRVKPDGSAFEIYARGVRNSVGFDWQPQTGVLWFTDNGRDWLGDDRPPDELNAAPRPGMNFGYPYCHGGDIADPEFGAKHPCADFTPPAMKLGPHVAALGMRFYTGTMFPAEYRGQIFVAEHGSWNRSEPIGYRVVVVHLRDGEPVREEIFATGWLGNGNRWGRPVDVEVMPDGALLVSDDYGGMIYRITYGPKSP
jgi:glucose/arabinose dehydrogenase